MKIRTRDEIRKVLLSLTRNPNKTIIGWCFNAWEGRPCKLDLRILFQTRLPYRPFDLVEYWVSLYGGSWALTKKELLAWQ